MKVFIKILWFLILVVLTPAGIAKSKKSGVSITGAFGVDFSKSIKEQAHFNDIKKSNIHKFGTFKTIFLSPPEKSKYFNDYAVTVSPYYQNVIAVHGFRLVSSSKECKEKANKVYSLVERKYSYRSGGDPIFSPFLLKPKLRAIYNKDFFVFNKQLSNTKGRIIVSCDVQAALKCPDIKHPYSSVDLRELSLRADEKNHQYMSYLLINPPASFVIRPFKALDKGKVFWPAPSYIAKSYMQCLDDKNNYLMRITYENTSAISMLNFELETLAQKAMEKNQDAKGL